jgi:hypothetical protein
MNTSNASSNATSSGTDRPNESEAASSITRLNWSLHFGARGTCASERFNGFSKMASPN